MFKTNWIWIPGWSAEDKDEPSISYFRKEFEVHKVPEKLEIMISADSRYKLYVNGKLTEIGSSKGDNHIWYYDTVDLAPHLTPGKNILAVIVLRYPIEAAKGNLSIFRTETPGFYCVGEYADENGQVISLSTDESWKCLREPNVKLIPDNPLFSHLHIQEKASGNPDTFGWMKAGYQSSNWLSAVQSHQFVLNMAVSPGNLHARTIPYMNKIPRKFEGIIAVRDSKVKESEWNNMLAGVESVTVLPNSREVVEISAGELMTGFLKLSIIGGRGSTIKILQSEAYVQPQESDDPDVSLPPKKRDRLDYKNGFLQGYADSYEVAGIGQDGEPEIYEPFWFKTFRFIQLEIVTADEPLTIKSFDYQETGYPLKVKTWVKTSDESMQAIWDISERSLRRCMHETYEDCPFYEQLQYAMDTRAQILYTYMTSADDRLARKCFDDFRRSQHYDGMISCSYPCYSYTIIPGFSIYYIMMLYDHMMYFGDKELIRSYLTTIDGILEYFHRRLTKEGIVGKIGGYLFRDAAWSFIDWTAKWDGGVPPAILSGPITMESLLYVMGLEHASKLASFAGRDGVADEYTERAGKVKEAIRSNCMGNNGMIQDGPGIDEYSQHCQVFAILTDTIGLEQGKENLLKTLQNKQEYAQCTVAMAYYLYRALEKCNLYEYTGELWDIWRDMIKNNLTTCVEDPVSQRSDCHAWGALALYELPAVILGVRPTKPGFEEMEIKPVPGPFTWAEGEVITPKGMVRVQWKKVGEGIELQHQLIESGLVKYRTFVSGREDPVRR